MYSLRGPARHRTSGNGQSARNVVDIGSGGDRSLSSEAAKIDTTVREIAFPSLSRIAVVRALPGLGDMLCAVPALRCLRKAAPQASITLIGLETSRSFASRFSRYIDDFLVLPQFPGIWEPGDTATEKLPVFLNAARARRFDLAIQLHGSGSASNSLTCALDPAIAAGFFPKGSNRPAKGCFFPYPESLPEPARNLRLLAHLGIATDSVRLEFPLTSADFEELASHLPRDAGLAPQTYACVHPGARSMDRRWRPEAFAQVADWLHDHGLRIVLTGNANEKDCVSAVAAAMRSESIDAASVMSFGALAALLSNARLLVCNDTGVSHLAAARSVPSIIIFSNSDPQRWAPADSSRHRALFETGGRIVSAERVIHEANALLGAAA
jgi:ADP-heptose:LPS heptosyltransferase